MPSLQVSAHAQLHSGIAWPVPTSTNKSTGWKEAKGTERRFSARSYAMGSGWPEPRRGAICRPGTTRRGEGTLGLRALKRRDGDCGRGACAGAPLTGLDRRTCRLPRNPV